MLDEAEVRRDLAACFRLIAKFGWDDIIFTHASARVPGRHGEFLTNPFGMMFHEVTASDLVRVAADGEALSPQGARINLGAFTLHGALHMARPEVGCAIHTHTVAGVAVATQADGLRPISQMALSFNGRLAYHDYEGPTVDLAERQRFLANFGNKVALVLRNHGLMTVGHTVGDAFHELYFLEKACQIQIAALSGGAAIITPPASVLTRFGLPEGCIEGRGRMTWTALRDWLDKTDASYRT